MYFEWISGKQRFIYDILTCLFLGTFHKMRKATNSVVVSVCMSVYLSVRMEQLHFHWRDFRENWYLSIFRSSVKKIDIILNLTRVTGTLYEYLCAFITISLSFLLTMRNVSDKVYISRPTRCTNSYNVSLFIIKCSTCFGLFSPSAGATFWSCIS